MLLPLSWSRDAYYVARALLRWHPELAEIVRRHLLWMFETAERVDGLWGRAYLANGRVKDRAYQLDQQLFPLLELADYVLATGDRALLHELEERSVLPLIGILLARRAPEGWLFATDETPADDPLTLPYHLSSHILMWRTFRRLAEAGMNSGLTSLAEDIRGAINTHFIAEHDGPRLYAYATDGQGAFRFYHDANDIPLVLAPAWGFVPADDPVWRATVDFAFSAANEGGFYTSGLGSVHTPAPWPLGDVQDLIVARALADEDRARRAWDRLHAAARWDGALPEASHAETHAVVSRYWFAWPNAALACVALGAFD
jgi:GH15 family glucan-1,4-alpha-glucosidase